MSRELDAEVAEKVMGAKPSQHPGFNHANGIWWQMEDMNYGEATCELPCYSTDIAAAWEVHLRMRKRLCSVRRKYCAALQRIASDASGLESELIAWPDLVFFIEPGFICRAALEAVK